MLTFRELAAAEVVTGNPAADDWTPEERAGMIAWNMARGAEYTLAQVAAITGLTISGARQLLCKLSRPLPICPDDDGIWKPIY